MSVKMRRLSDALGEEAMATQYDSTTPQATSIISALPMARG
jgi:hypothetical protein